MKGIKAIQTEEEVTARIVVMTPTGSTKEFIDRMALEGLKKFGVNNAIELIQAWQKAGHITRKQSHDLRKKIDVLSGGHESHEFSQIKK